MISRVWALCRNWRNVKTALSTLSHLYDAESDALDALGGLTDEEMKAVCAWGTEEMGMTIVEVGTLFGLTARELDRQVVGGRIIAVDNFTWNPFGLPPNVHEAFTRRILRDTKVELLNCSSADWRNTLTGRIDMIFFDASHSYEDVKAECEWAKARGIPSVCGHDYGNPNPRFGVTRAVDEVFGKENVEVVGMCWRARVGN